MLIQKQLTADAAGALERLAGSGTFAKSQRSVQLLRHLLQMKQDGREDEVKEYTLAAEVFGRESYDPKVDSTVRVEASRLRSLLAKYYEGEGAADPVRIAMPKGGYLLTVEVAQPAEAMAAVGRPKPRWGWWIAAAVLGVAAMGAATMAWRRTEAPPRAHRLAMAILPFAAEAGQEGCADGLVDDLSAKVAEGGAVDLVSRSSAFAYRTTRKTAQEIGKELGVAALVTGSIRQQQGRTRVNVQFIDARTGFAIWTWTDDLPVDNPLEAQSEAARRIAFQVLHEMVLTRNALLAAPPRQEEAWKRYLRATRYSETAPDGVEAIDLFEAAAAADPEFVSAWIGAASAAARLYEWGLLPRARLESAVRAADRALALEPQSVEGLVAKGRLVLLRSLDWTQTEALLRRAMDLDPAQVDAPFYLARLVLVPQGRFAEAIRLLEHATAVDPTRFDAQIELAAAHVRSGDWGKAEVIFARRREDPAPALAVWKGIAVAARGRFEEALPLLRDAARRNPGRWTKAHVGYVLARAGKAAEAGQLLEDLSRLPGSSLDQAAIRDAMGDREGALPLLEQAVREMHPAVFWLQVDYRLERLRQDARVQSLMTHVKFPR